MKTAQNWAMPSPKRPACQFPMQKHTINCSGRRNALSETALEQYAYLTQWLLTGSFTVTALAFVVSCIAARRWSWFMLHLVVCSAATITVDQVRCEYLLTLNTKVVFTVALIISRTLAHWELARDALAEAKWERQVVVAGLAIAYALGCGGLMYWMIEPGVYAGGAKYGRVWDLWDIYIISIATSTVYVLCSYGRAPWPVSQVNRWYGGLWAVFVLGYGANAYVPSVAGWYWTIIIIRPIHILCLAGWLWPLGRAALKRRPPMDLPTAKAADRSRGMGKTLELLSQQVARRREPASPRKRSFET